MKSPRFEVHFIIKKKISADDLESGLYVKRGDDWGHYQWFLKHSNRKTLAMGRPQGFRSIKGCLDSMEVVREILDGDNVRGRYHRTESDIFYAGCTGNRKLKEVDRATDSCPSCGNHALRYFEQGESGQTIYVCADCTAIVHVHDVECPICHKQTSQNQRNADDVCVDCQKSGQNYQPFD